MQVYIREAGRGAIRSQVIDVSLAPYSPSRPNHKKGKKDTAESSLETQRAYHKVRPSIYQVINPTQSNNLSENKPHQPPNKQTSKQDQQKKRQRKETKKKKVHTQPLIQRLPTDLKRQLDPSQQARRKTYIRLGVQAVLGQPSGQHVTIQGAAAGQL
jgi:hypothetical protein